MKLLDASAVSYADRPDQARRGQARRPQARIEATLEALRAHPAAYPGTFFTSSRTGEGIPELRGHIVQLMRERGGAQVGGGA